MHLFAANCTPQNYEYNFRIPENNRTLKQMIPSGENRLLGDKDLTAAQIDSIIEQGRIYGMVEFDKLDDALGESKQVSLIFRRNEPVSAEVIRDVIAINRKELTDIGRKRRQELAIGVARVMDPQNPQSADRVSVGIEEVEVGTIHKEAGAKTEEGFAGPESRQAKETGMKGRRR